MTGKRVLLAAEFMRGGATAVRLLPLAVALAGRGHDVTMALPAELAASGASAGVPVVDAPCWTVAPPPGFTAVSYADLLMHSGYATPDTLRGLMGDWRGVLDRVTPDLLVADFAPTAMLAARAAGIGMAAVGDGYSLPPLTVPLPGMRPWADVPADDADSVEGRVLAVINARFGALGCRELRRLRDMFADVACFVCTFPELDHYPIRPDAAPYGEVFAPSSGSAPAWPAGVGERLYVELDPHHPALDAIVAAVDRLGLPTLIHAAGMEARQADAIERATIQVTTSANRAALLAGCDIAVCQARDVAVQALLAGKPLLMVPVFVEQMMTLHRVATQGLGHGIEPTADAAAVDAAVRRLVDDRACRLRAVNFARLYDGYQPDIAIDAVAGAIDELLA
ncbi:MAG TPA: hypothetical protein VGM42_08620 [Rhodopila sp.]